jgi:hypothetical protein
LIVDRADFGLATLQSGCDDALSSALRQYRRSVLPGDRRNPLEGDKTMKLQDPIANAQTTSRSILRSDVAEESRNDKPSLAEIRERAFEIHIEHGGIHGCDLDDWLQAERELQEKYNKSNDGRPKKK